ncbi:MAG: lipopolysaccharide biosynthesis protein [Pseudomonadota bacterium]
MNDIAVATLDDFALEREQGLADYIAAARRRGKLILTVFCTALVLALLTALLWPAKYRSSATILIEQQEIPQDMVRSTITSYADQRVQIISQQVMTTSNLLEIIRKFDLYPDLLQSRAREVVLERMRDDISLDMISADVVDPRSGRPTQATIAFTLAYEAPSADTAVRVATDLTDKFLTTNLETRTQKVEETAEFLASEAERLSGEIKALETRLSGFKTDNVDQLPELTELNLTLMNRSELEVKDVERQLRSIAERKIYLQAELAQLAGAEYAYSETGEKIYSPADRLKFLEAQLATLEAQYSEEHPDVIRARREVAALKDRNDVDAGDPLAELTVERARLLEIYTPSHPEVRDIERQIEAYESGLGATFDELSDNPAVTQLKAQLAAADADEASLLALQAELKARVRSFEERLARTPEIERDYYALTRDLDNARLKYREVRAREMEAKLAQSMETDRKGERFNLIEPPLAPQKPYSPNRILIAALGLFVAIGAAVAAVVVAEALDTSIRGSAALSRRSGTQLIGVIPVISLASEDSSRRRRLRLAATATISACIALFIAVHFFYRPLDVLFYATLRKLGI